MSPHTYFNAQIHSNSCMRLPARHDIWRPNFQLQQGQVDRMVTGVSMGRNGPRGDHARSNACWTALSAMRSNCHRDMNDAVLLKCWG